MNYGRQVYTYILDKELTSREGSDKLCFTPFSLSFDRSGIHCQPVSNVFFQFIECALPSRATEVLLTLMADPLGDRDVVAHKAGDDAIWRCWVLPTQSY